MSEKNKSIELIERKKKEFKETQFRRVFDELVQEIDRELIDTKIRFDALDYAANSFVYIPSVDSSGRANPFIIPTVQKKGDNNHSKMPRSKESIIFSKVLTVTSALFANIPNATTDSSNKLKARIYKEIWKQGWLHPQGNGLNTLSIAGQNLVTYGWTAWRVFPRIDTVSKNGTDKILFDGIYREPLDPKRTWLGTSYKPSAQDSRVEVLYEIDITKDEYTKLLKKFGKRYKKGSVMAGVSEEADAEDSDISNTHVTLRFYEDPHNNRYIISSDVHVLYDGELPNDDIYGGVVVSHLYLKDMNDPHGVGLFEMIRGNVATYNYINSMTLEEVEAEVFPLLFASGNVGNGNLNYKRHPNKINLMPAGVKIDKIQGSGNATLAINVADKQKENLENNSGVNDAMSGTPTEGGLGETVMQREAALNRWIIPRNNIKIALETDAQIVFSWLECLYKYGRVATFKDEYQALEFEKINRCFFTEQVVDPDDEEKITINYSPAVSIPFDYKIDDETQELNIMEHGQEKVQVSIKTLLEEVEKYEEDVEHGYAEVSFRIDPNSLLVPSIEVQKQSSQALFPIIVNHISLIYQMARQDPEQAVTQLTTFSTFCKEQRIDVFSYIPKAQYDMIMNGGVPVDMQTQMQAEQHMAQQQNGKTMNGDMDNNYLTAGTEQLGDNQLQTQSIIDAARRQGQTPLQSSQQASMGRLGSSVESSTGYNQ